MIFESFSASEGRVFESGGNGYLFIREEIGGTSINRLDFPRSIPSKRFLLDGIRGKSQAHKADLTAQ